MPVTSPLLIALRAAMKTLSMQDPRHDVLYNLYIAEERMLQKIEREKQAAAGAKIINDSFVANGHPSIFPA